MDGDIDDRQPYSPFLSAADFSITIERTDSTPRFQEWSSTVDSSSRSTLADDRTLEDRIPSITTSHIPSTKNDMVGRPDDPKLELNSVYKFGENGDSQDDVIDSVSPPRKASLKRELPSESQSTNDTSSVTSKKQPSLDSEPFTVSSSTSSYAREYHRPAAELHMLCPARRSRHSKLLGSSYDKEDASDAINLSLQGRSQGVLMYHSCQDDGDMCEAIRLGRNNVTRSGLPLIKDTATSNVQFDIPKRADEHHSPLITPQSERIESRTLQRPSKPNRKPARSHDRKRFSRPLSVRSHSHEHVRTRKTLESEELRSSQPLVKSPSQSQSGGTKPLNDLPEKIKSAETSWKRKFPFFGRRRASPTPPLSQDEIVRVSGATPSRKLLLAPTTLLPVSGYVPIHFLESEAKKVMTPKTSPQTSKRSYFHFDFYPPGSGETPSDRDGERTPMRTLAPRKAIDLPSSTPGLSIAHPHSLGTVDWFRIRSDEDTRTDKEIANELAYGKFEWDVPEHLPSSPLCPLHPKHPSGGKGICVYHGRRKSSKQSIATDRDFQGRQSVSLSRGHTPRHHASYSEA